MARESLDLVPDEGGVRAVQTIWQRLADAGLPSQAEHRGHSNKVHLTLAESSTIPDPAAALDVVGPLLPLTLPVTGVVVLGGGKAAVALLLSAPPDVVDVAARLRDELGRSEPPWVPHVTLARQVPRDQVGRVVDAVTGHGISALRFVQLRHWQPQTRVVSTLAAEPG